jgi:hypothetical protein
MSPCTVFAVNCHIATPSNYWGPSYSEIGSWRKLEGEFKLFAVHLCSDVQASSQARSRDTVPLIDIFSDTGTGNRGMVGKTRIKNTN